MEDINKENTGQELPREELLNNQELQPTYTVSHPSTEKDSADRIAELHRQLGIVNKNQESHPGNLEIEQKIQGLSADIRNLTSHLFIRSDNRLEEFAERSTLGRMSTSERLLSELKFDKKEDFREAEHHLRNLVRSITSIGQSRRSNSVREDKESVAKLPHIFGKVTQDADRLADQFKKQDHEETLFAERAARELAAVSHEKRLYFGKLTDMLRKLR